MRTRNRAAAATAFVVVAAGGIAISNAPRAAVIGFAVAFAAVVALALHRLLREPALLQRQIDRRTQELQASLLEAWLQKRQLQAAQDHVEGILRATPDAVVAGTGSGVITEWNAAAEEVYGWSRDQAVGRDVSFIVPAGRKPAILEHAAALRTGQPVRVIVPSVRSDGSGFMAELTLSGFHDDRGRLRSWVAVARDVTEPELVRLARGAMSSALEPALALEALSDAMEQATGCSALAVALVDGKHLRPLGTDVRLAPGPAEAEALQDGAPVLLHNAEDDLLLGPGPIDRLLVLPMQRDGRPFAALAMAFPATREPSTAMVRALAGAAQAITQEVANILVYQRERDAAAKLRELDELQSDFLSTVSHELRTPLTTIGGFAATLDRRWDELDDATRRGFLRRILRKTHDLDEVIGGLLAFSSLERGGRRLSVQPCRVREALEREASRLEQTLAGHEVRIEAPDGLTALADPQALSGVLGNLLTNAAKFSPKGTEITLRATSEAGEVTIAVTDQGPGIPAEEHGRIFERFYRVERGDRVVADGTGIGLAVAKQLVEALGGRIRVHSRGGAGATFTVTLPLAATAPDMSVSPAEKDRSARRAAG